MEEDIITGEILKCVFEVHTIPGPGLSESSYLECLYYELIKSGFKTEKQKPLPLIYKDIIIDIEYRADLYVEDSVIVEIKTVESFNNIHLSQMISCLKLSKCRVGLLLNFKVCSLRSGIKRVVNNL